MKPEEIEIVNEYTKRTGARGPSAGWYIAPNTATVMVLAAIAVTP